MACAMVSRVVGAFVLARLAVARAIACDVRRVDARAMASEEFRRAFRGREAAPLILSGLAFGLEGKALKAWRAAAMLRRFGSLEVQSQHAVVYRAPQSGAPLRTGLGAPTTVRSLFALRDETLVLLKPAHASMKLLERLLEIPEALTPLRLTGPTLSVGGNGSSSPFHQHQENWFWQTQGRKAWVMGPADDEIGNLVKGLHPCELLRRRPATRAARRLRQCVVKEGEVVYLPHQWHHGTCNLGELSLGVGYIGGLDHLPPLHFAAAVGDEAALAELMRSADISSIDGEGQSPLHWAAQRGHGRMVERLLDLRADPRAMDTRGARPAHTAAFEGQLGTLRILSRADRDAAASAPTTLGARPLHLAASRGHTDIVEELLRSRAGAGVRDKSGAEPLHMAAYEGHMSVARMLVASGAKPSSQSKDGTRPEQLAAKRGHSELAQWLAGASSLSPGPRGREL